MTNTVRHLTGLLVAATVLLAGCSSTTAGSGLGAAAPASGSTGIAGTGSAPSTVPTNGSTGVGGSGGSPGTAAFCAQFKDMQQIGTGGLDRSAVRRVVAYYDKLYELAPPAIKADAKVLDDYVHAFTGNAPPTDPGSFADAYANVVTWAAQNCN